jgi:hypothetical protein
MFKSKNELTVKIIDDELREFLEGIDRPIDEFNDFNKYEEERNER